jgi:hypothetical protein
MSIDRAPAAPRERPIAEAPDVRSPLREPDPVLGCRAAATSTPRRMDYLWMIAGQAAAVAVVQLAPMLLLALLDYAAYSAIYLGSAICLAIVFAVLGDVWARRIRREPITESLLRSYQATLTSLSLLGGLVAGGITGTVAADPLLGGLAGLAVAAATYRAGISYRLMALGRVRRSGLTELGGVLLGAGALSAFWFADAYSISSALLCWAVLSLGGAALAAVPPCWDARAAVAWISTHRAEIRVLLGEALIKNIESAGTPYVVGGIGGALALALHRAGSSLTYPMRLIMDVLRSRIISGAVTHDARTVLALVVLGAMAGAGVSGGLRVVAEAGLLDPDSVMAPLSEQALAVGAWVWLTALSSFLQFSGRGAFRGRTLLVRRTAHTVVILGVTISALIVFGIGGVIWGAALARLVSIPLWIPPRPGALHEGDPR